MFSVNYFLMPDEVMMLSPVYYRPAEPETGLASQSLALRREQAIACTPTSLLLPLKSSAPGVCVFVSTQMWRDHACLQEERESSKLERERDEVNKEINKVSSEIELALAIV